MKNIYLKLNKNSKIFIKINIIITPIVMFNLVLIGFMVSESKMLKKYF